ncbi:MAG: serine hydrolase domain-containing protein [Alteraurantiacibacter sp.]
MRWPGKTWLALAAALALAGCATGPRLMDESDPATQAFYGLENAGFTGDFAISRPGEVDTIFYGGSEEDAGDRVIEGWPWASVTKQVMAVLVMREVEDGRLSLDTDVGQYVPRLRHAGVTVEDLLRHRSGLPQPDKSATDEEDFPSFYTAELDRLDWCTRGLRPRPDAGLWEYNNCDYIVLSAVLEAVSDSSVDLLLAQGVGLESGWINTSFFSRDDTRYFAGRTPMAASRVAGYEAAAGLVGPLDDMLAFDRALMDGLLLSEESLAALWDSDPALGYMALGQWVFEAPLTGCNGAVKIVERRGAIGKYQVRNIILPESGIALALATDQPEFQFGELWSGEGPLHATLSAVACD